MKTSEQLIRDYLMAGGKVVVANTRRAIGSKTFRGRYTQTVAGAGRKASGLRDHGLAKAHG